METPNNGSTSKGKSHSKIKVNWPQVGLQLGLAVTTALIGGIAQGAVLRAFGSALPMGETVAGNVVALARKVV